MLVNKNINWLTSSNTKAKLFGEAKEFIQFTSSRVRGITISNKLFAKTKFLKFPPFRPK